MEWKVSLHKFKSGDSNHPCEVCAEDYWDHKWNPHTITIWRLGTTVGAIMGFLIGIGFGIFVIGILTK